MYTYYGNFATIKHLILRQKQQNINDGSYKYANLIIQILAIWNQFGMWLQLEDIYFVN